MRPLLQLALVTQAMQLPASLQRLPRLGDPIPSVGSKPMHCPKPPQVAALGPLWPLPNRVVPLCCTQNVNQQHDFQGADGDYMKMIMMTTRIMMTKMTTMTMTIMMIIIMNHKSVDDFDGDDEDDGNDGVSLCISNLRARCAGLRNFRVCGGSGPKAMPRSMLN